MHRLGSRAHLKVLDGDQVCDASAALTNTAELQRCATVLDALADERRLSLLLVLHQIGNMYVSDLAVATGMTDSAASHALRLLRAQQIVTANREGRYVRYQLVDPLARRLLSTVSEQVVGELQVHTVAPAR